MEVGLLGLADGVIAAVVDQEDLNGQMVVDDGLQDRKSTRLNSSHITRSRMPSSA